MKVKFSFPTGPNKNGRTYPYEVTQRAIRDYVKRMENKKGKDIIFVQEVSRSSDGVIIEGEWDGKEV